VIGTRPEAIKLAPVAHALSERGLAPVLVLTGQHPDLSPREFGLADFPLQRLFCPGQADPHRHVGTVTAALQREFGKLPALLVVQGDTSSALGAALAAFTAEVPVAHVEAGLRTHDPLLPWPEEEYRIAIDANADLLFAPTETAAANLRAENVPGEIHITGNTAIDALVAAEADLPPPSPRERASPMVVVTCHRRESWGEGLESIASSIAELANRATIRLVLHPNPRVQTQIQARLGCVPNVELIEPRSHRDLLELMRDADLVMSDSGGIQEETPSLGTPLLVLREKTERPEGIAVGSARLVGTSTDRIVREARHLLDNPAALAAMSVRRFPYGDGRAAPRIAAIIEDWLDRRDRRSWLSSAIPRTAGSRRQS